MHHQTAFKVFFLEESDPYLGKSKKKKKDLKSRHQSTGHHFFNALGEDRLCARVFFKFNPSFALLTFQIIYQNQDRHEGN